MKCLGPAVTVAVMMAGSASAFDEPDFASCSGVRSELGATIRAASYGAGDTVAQIVGTALDLFSGGGTCTQTDPGEGSTGGAGRPGEVTSDPGGMTGSAFTCPFWAPYYRCDWTGYCWCSAY